MESLALVKRMVEYDNWSNLQTLALLDEVTKVDRKPLDIMVHIFNSAKWLLDIIEDRLGKDNSVWQEGIAYDDYVQKAESLIRRYEKYLESLSEDELNRQVDLPGEQKRVVHVRDVLMQLITHSPHHRGQVITAVRAAGMVPGVPNRINYINYALRK
jgi:uncharacterized damage-inducible protein DinB